MQPLRSFLPNMEVETASYNNFLYALIDKNSRAYDDEIKLILCHIDADELLSDSESGNMSDAYQTYITAIENFLELNPNKLLLTNLMCRTSYSYYSYSEPIINQSPATVERLLNTELINLAKKFRQLCILDLDLIYREHGAHVLHNLNYWYIGRIKYSNVMFRTLAQHYMQLLNAVRGISKKVLVLDLDNTLWGGVIGEDGVSGIVLSEDGKGKCYRDFQKAVMGLKKRGIILAINSKNNSDDVEHLFATHKLMVLTLDDFIIKKINWQNKIINMVEIAKELNVGLDSLVFIDDNPVERALIKEHLPEVYVPEFPNNLENYTQWFTAEVVSKLFPKYHLTDEDLQKTSQYKAKVERDKIEKILDYDSFLKNLDIKLSYYIDEPNYANRAAQLSQKTNQFNMTTKRYTSAEIESLMKDSCYRVVLVDYTDRFGAEGIVGLGIINLKNSEIDTFLISCRVIGREVENNFLAFLEKILADTGESVIHASFIPTNKNTPASNFYENNHYHLDKNTDYEIKKFSKLLGGKHERG